MVTGRQNLMMGYPWIGFYEFIQIPHGIYSQYKMYYVDKVLIDGVAFYFHNN